MGRGCLSVAACLWVAALAATYAGQCQAQQEAKAVHICECGTHPPAPPQDRVVEPYAGEPKDLSPYAKFAAPYDRNYIHPNIYSGAARDLPDPTDMTEVRIGFLGPIEHNPQAAFGQRMLHGAQLAVDDANARGGYGGKPFRLMLHNDYNNWTAMSVYGDDRPTDPAEWGSASNEVVKMVYDEQDWAIFGSISSESTHIALRVALRAEIPIVNSASTDPTIPETYIPWYFTDLQDDRVQSLTLARHIFTELGLKRVALLRVNERYGRFGVPKFRDAARRLGHPVVIEQKYLPGDTDFTRQLKVIRSSRADAIVVWGDEEDAANILKQMRAAGIQEPVFGSHRTLGETLLKEAGAAAEGFEAVFPYDPSRQDQRWLDFNRHFEDRFHQKPEQFAALAYDAMDALLDSICKAGLNRARIHDALADIASYEGVTGRMVFDPNQKNVAPLYLGTVHKGAITYRVATMSTPPSPRTTSTPSALTGEVRAANINPLRDKASPNTAVRKKPSLGPARVLVFGPRAEEITKSPEVKEVLAAGDAEGQPLQLIPVASNQNWGASVTELVHALMDGPPLAILALDRDSSHLAEQLALKTFVPVIALSSDKTLTSANIPWIFRLPPATSPASALRLLQDAVSREENGADTADPERLRNVLASGEKVAGIAFLPTGEPRIP